MQITRKSMFTGAVNTMDIPCTQEQIDRWRGGEMIQNAMPNVSPDHLEFLMTGVTPEEWRKTFGEA